MSARPSLNTANSARAVAERRRSAALIEVASGEASVADVITAAATEAGRPLLRITLRQLLLAQPGWGTERTAKVLSQTLTVLESQNVPMRRLTIAWLLDPRAGGRRLMAFCDSLSTRTEPPWVGFPFMPKPQRSGKQTVGAA